MMVYKFAKFWCCSPYEPLFSFRKTFSMIQQCPYRFFIFSGKTGRHQYTIRIRRQEAISFRLDADLLRIQADMACLLGSKESETHGMSQISKHNELLQMAQEKQKGGHEKGKRS